MLWPSAVRGGEQDQIRSAVPPLPQLSLWPPIRPGPNLSPSFLPKKQSDRAPMMAYKMCLVDSEVWLCASSKAWLARMVESVS